MDVSGVVGMVPPPVPKATRLVNHLQHVIVKESVLRSESEPRFVIRPQILVILFVAVCWSLRGLETHNIKNTLSCKIQIHEDSCVLMWILWLCGCVVNFQNVLSIDCHYHVFRMAVGRGRCTHVLCTLRLHSDVHVVIVCKVNIIENVLSVEVRMVFHLQRVKGVPGDIAAEVLISLHVSRGQLLFRNLVKSEHVFLIKI